MAIGAKRRLRDPARQGLAVDAGPVLLDYLAVAHAAGIGDGRAEYLRLGRQQLVGAAVAERAIRRALVSVLAGLAVHAAGVIAGLVLVAGGTNRLGNAGGVGILFVGFVAGVAGQPRVSALFQLLPLVVAGSALSGWRLVGCFEIGAGCPEDQAN